MAPGYYAIAAAAMLLTSPVPAQVSTADPHAAHAGRSALAPGAARESIERQSTSANGPDNGLDLKTKLALHAQAVAQVNAWYEAGAEAEIGARLADAADAQDGIASRNRKPVTSHRRPRAESGRPDDAATRDDARPRAPRSAAELRLLNGL